MCGKDNKLLSCTDDLQGQTYPSAYLFIISCLGNRSFPGRKRAFPEEETPVPCAGNYSFLNGKLRGNCNRLSRSIIMKIAADTNQRLFCRAKALCF